MSENAISLCWKSGKTDSGSGSDPDHSQNLINSPWPMPNPSTKFHENRSTTFWITFANSQTDRQTNKLTNKVKHYLLTSTWVLIIVYCLLNYCTVQCKWCTDAGKTETTCICIAGNAAGRSWFTRGGWYRIVGNCVSDHVSDELRVTTHYN